MFVCLVLCIICMFCLCLFLFFFKQKTAYEMRISDWSSDVCSSDLLLRAERGDITKGQIDYRGERVDQLNPSALVKKGLIQVMEGRQIGRASCRERVCQYV